MKLQLMKGTCVHCHRFTCQTNGVAAKILLAQLRALDLGMLSTAHQLESYISEKFSHTGNSIGL